MDKEQQRRAGRPPSGKPRRAGVCVTIQSPLLPELDRLAHRRGLSRSRLVENAVMALLRDDPQIERQNEE